MIVTYTQRFATLTVVAALALPATAQTPLTRLSTAEHAKAIATFQQELNTEYRDAEHSPLPAAERRKFKALPFFPVDYSYYVEARLVRDSTSAPFPMKTSNMRRPLYRKYGDLYFTLQGQPLHLTVYESLDLKQKPGYEDYLFLPFTDPTNGHTSYGGGRYLDLRAPNSNTIWLDFNRAYNPYCAYSPNYSCPVPPPENNLPLPIQAGVQSDH
jgi:uncharacterized protein (DUF1684 family)